MKSREEHLHLTFYMKSREEHLHLTFYMKSREEHLHLTFYMKSREEHLHLTFYMKSREEHLCTLHVKLRLFLEVCLLAYTRGEFNNASARRALVDWYLSLFIMCKAWHQYNESPRVLALLNSPLKM